MSAHISVESDGEMAAAAELVSTMKVSRVAGALSRALKGSKVARLADSAPREVVDDIFGCALKRQTGRCVPVL